jgi:hypothetical protein
VPKQPETINGPCSINNRGDKGGNYQLMRSKPAHNAAMSAPIAKAISSKRKNFRFTVDALGIVSDIVGQLYQGRPPNHCLRKGLVWRRCAASGSRHKRLRFKYDQYVRAMFQG